jgi:S-formylglutathione hydrolase FrmB
VEGRSFASKALAVTKRYLVYLPRAYDESTRRFPVVIMLHGLGGDETNWTRQGGLQQTADAVGLSAIVVMPDGDDSFYTNGVASIGYEACLERKPPWNPTEPSTTYCVHTPRYEDYIVFDLVAEVERHHRAIADRRSRGIGGLSMGGFGALSLAMRHPDMFAAAASQSGMVAMLYRGPHPYVRGRETLADDVASWGGQYSKPFREHVIGIFGSDTASWRAHDPAALASRLSPGSLALRFDCGASDGYHFEDHASYLHDVLGARAIPHEFAIVPGEHSWKLWRATLSESLKFFAATLAH